MDKNLILAFDEWTSALDIQSRTKNSGIHNLSLAGIKQLKSLILDLAVSGKLIVQDQDGQSAESLLEELKAIQEKLIEQGGLRTVATYEVKPAEKFVGEPTNWTYIRLGNLARFIDYRGKTPNKINSGIRLITAKNVKFGYISLEPEEFISEKEYQDWMTRGFPRVGDLLFTTEAPLGNVAIIDLEEKFALAQRVICLQLHDAAISPFLKLVMLSPRFQKLLLDKATGMTATGIKAAKLKELVVPLPPLTEQIKIVAKVERLMNLCANLEQKQFDSIKLHDVLVKEILAVLLQAKDSVAFQNAWGLIDKQFDNLFSNENSIEALKSAIIQLAIMGKLVDQKASDEDAGVLFERIQTQKDELIEQQKLRKQKSFAAIDQKDFPFSIPDSWRWTRLGEVTNYGILQRAEPGDVGPECWILELEDVEKDTSTLLQKVRVGISAKMASRSAFKLSPHFALK